MPLRKHSTGSKSSSPSCSTLNISREADLLHTSIRIHLGNHHGTQPFCLSFHVVNGVPSPSLHSPPSSYDSAEKSAFDSEKIADLPHSVSNPGPSLPSPLPTTGAEENESSPKSIKSKTSTGSKPSTKKFTTTAFITARQQ
jgi:hypothetical protein